MLAAAGCTTTVEHVPREAHFFRDKGVLVLDATRLDNVPAQVLEDVQQRLETELAGSPYLGRVVTRQAFLDGVSPGTTLRNRYRQLSDTLSVLMFTDRDLTTRLARDQDVELLGLVELYPLPCPGCTDFDSRLGMIAVLVEASSGELAWRAHLTRDMTYGEDAAETMARHAGLMEDRLARLLHRLIRPKAHRERFANLRALAAG